MEKNNVGDNFPQDFRCPISMELMKDPVTISTGVTYDRKNIEKWFNVYKKNTCPATMQCVHSFDITPNHTLKRLILAWHNNRDDLNRPSPKYDELAALLGEIDSTPFKVSALRKLRLIVESNDQMMKDFKGLGGVEVLVRIMVQILVENSDFSTFRACEEALGFLHQVPFSDEDEEIFQLLMNPSFLKSMSIMLQRGSSEARFCAISTFSKMGKWDNHQWNTLIESYQGIEFFKSLMEILSDEICNKVSSCALKLLIETLENSRKSRLKAIEAGAVTTLIEILPDSTSKSRCEKIMQVIKLLCECADGRLSFIEHGFGIAAVSKKMMMNDLSLVGMKIGVKIMWLISSFHPTERVLEEMVVCGAVEKMVALLHVGGGATRDRVAEILKMHGGTWRRYPCFPTEVKNYLG